MKRRSFFTLLGAGTLSAAPLEKKRDLIWKWPCMGSQFKAHLQLSDGQSPQSLASLKKKIETLLRQLELTFSVHRPDSEVLTLCRKGNAHPGEAIPVSESFLHLTREAVKYSEKTQGHFDITFGSLTSYWRYCAASQVIPNEQRIELLKKRLGSDQLHFHEKAISFHPHDKQILLDYGGIAKGYAADCVMALLLQAKISTAVIDLGGEIVAHDPPAGKSGWPIVLLDQAGKATGQKISLAHRALSTSGDLYQSIRTDGVHLSHVLSPAQSAGLRQNHSITVLAKTGLEADCLSTAAHAAHGSPAFDSIARLCEKFWVF